MREPSYDWLRKHYGGRHIALWKGRVVASNRSFTALMKKILPVYRVKPLTIAYIPPKGVACVYPVSA